MGLVKADAYGHGAVPIAQKLEELGADYLGVACLAEAVELRQAGVQTPILILGGTPAAYAAELVRYHITQACYDLDYAKALSAQVQETGGTLTVHIQCDTGMSRLGFLCHEDTMEQAAQEIAQAVELPGLHAEGIFTHFSDADGAEEYTMLSLTGSWTSCNGSKPWGTPLPSATAPIAQPPYSILPPTWTWFVRALPFTGISRTETWTRHCVTCGR